MPEDIEVNLRTVDEGTEAYERHSIAARKMGAETDSLAAKQTALHTKNLATLAGIQALNSGVGGLTSGFKSLGITNTAVDSAMAKVTATMQVLTGVMHVAKAAAMLASSAFWAKAIAGIAANLWLAPVVAAIVAGAVIAVWALKERYMAFGGAGVVREPTVFVAGEAGPEMYAFAPLSVGGTPTGAAVGTGGIIVNIYGTADRDAIFEMEQRLQDMIYGRGLG